MKVLYLFWWYFVYLLLYLNVTIYMVLKLHYNIQTVLYSKVIKIWTLSPIFTVFVLHSHTKFNLRLICVINLIKYYCFRNKNRLKITCIIVFSITNKADLSLWNLILANDIEIEFFTAIVIIYRNQIQIKINKHSKQ